MTRSWWDHADWYDLHDNTSVAGVEREPEHYRELVVIVLRALRSEPARPTRYVCNENGVKSVVRS